MSSPLIDPRFTTEQNASYAGPLFYSKLGVGPRPTVYIPAAAAEVWCNPGYQPKKADKGVALTVNDYVVGHNLVFGGSLWPEVVHTPFITDN